MWFLWLQVMAQTTEPRGCPARPVLHSQAAAFSNQQTLLEFICPSALWELSLELAWYKHWRFAMVPPPPLQSPLL